MRFHHRLHGHVPDCHPFRHEAAQEHLCSAKTVLTTGLLAVSTAGFAQPARTTAAYMENLELTREWDKVFPQSDKVNHSKITFARMFGDALTDMPTGKTTEVAFGSTQTWHTDVGRNPVRIPPRGHIRLPRRKHPDRRQGIFHTLGPVKVACKPPADFVTKSPKYRK